MSNELTKESKLADALKESQRRERLLEAKLRNQLARYTRLEEESASTGDSGLIGELEQCRSDLSRAERRRQHVLRELAQTQDEYLILEQRCAQEQQKSLSGLSREQDLLAEVGRLKASLGVSKQALKSAEAAHEAATMGREELKARLDSGSEKFQKMLADWEAKRSVLLSKAAEVEALKGRLTQSYLANERLKTQVVQQRQRLLLSHCTSF